jgi:hypothetical protein
MATSNNYHYKTVSILTQREIVQNCNYTSDPERAYNTTLQHMGEQKYIQSEVEKIRFINSMIGLRVATNEIETLAMKTIHGHRWREETRTENVVSEMVKILRVRLRLAEIGMRQSLRWIHIRETEMDEVIQTLGIDESNIRRFYMNLHRMRDFERSLISRELSIYYSKRIEGLRQRISRGRDAARQKEIATERLKGILVEDDDIEREETARDKIKEPNYMVIGDVTLDQDEVAFLSVHYKCRDHVEITERDTETEAEKLATKHRYDKMREGDEMEEMEEDEARDARKKLDEDRKKEQEERKILKGNSLDLTRVRTTDFPTNTRVYPPRAATNISEAKIQVQKDAIMKVNRKHIKTQYDETGEIVTSVLTAQETRGKIKIRDRVKKGEILITFTDKSGKTVVTTPDVYKKAAAVHLDKDEKVGWECLKKTETLMNRLARQLAKIFNLGKGEGDRQRDRINSALKSVDVAPPMVSFMWKDHKVYQDVPPTRPVCNATRGPILRTSQLLTMILTPVLDFEEDTTECDSTEDMLRAVQDTNAVIRGESAQSAQPNSGQQRQPTEPLMIFSQDASALYPTIKKEDVLSSIWDTIKESDIEFNDVDNVAMGKYLAITYSKEELRKHRLITCTPSRQVELDHTARAKPGLAYLDKDTYHRVVNGVKSGEIEKWNWIGKKQPSELQKKRMIALTLMKAVETVLGNHIYCFDGQLYRQREGGPIGDRLTTILARFITRKFVRGYIKKLSDLNINSLVRMIKIYVDDLNCVTYCLPWGTEYDGDKIVLPPARPPGDEGGTHSLADQQRQTARILREVANTILPRSVIMKEDTCPNHENGRIPILDTEMWVEDGQIRFSHYSKPMSSTEVVLARSAMAATMKRNILVQEGTRRLKNCHLSLTWKSKVVHINSLMISMRTAGHSAQFRTVVANRILANYSNIVTNDESGTKPMYRSKGDRKVQKEKEGIMNKSNWFHKGGYTATYTVPSTRDSTLVTSTRQALDSTTGPTHTRVKVLEKPGATILSGLIRSNPFPRESCGRLKCPLSWMKGGCQEKCFIENITYQAHCTRCRRAQIARGLAPNKVQDQVYEGESSRSLYTRSGQHVRDYVKESTRQRPPTDPTQGQVEEEVGSSFMWDHVLQCHQGQVSVDPSQDFQFRIAGQFHDALTRELDEATRILFARLRKSVCDRGQGSVLHVGGVLNRKDEHFAPRMRFY